MKMAERVPNQIGVAGKNLKEGAMPEHRRSYLAS